jgi:hypothetical protein
MQYLRLTYVSYQTGIFLYSIHIVVCERLYAKEKVEKSEEIW